MVSNVSQAIDLAIEKKLNSSISTKSHLNDFVKYSKYNSSQKNQFKNSFEDLLGDNVERNQRDLYNNKLYDYLKIKKTQCRFNLIRLFTPGEILNSVISN